MLDIIFAMLLKLIKWQLLIHFVLTFSTVFAFYYFNTLPDNFLSISSQSDSSFISYYASSVLSALSYFIGPWILFSFIGFLLAYAFIIRKRLHTADFFISFFFLSTSLLMALLINRTLVGTGLSQLIMAALNPLQIAMLLMASAVGLIGLLWRESSFYFMKTAFYRLKDLKLSKQERDFSPGKTAALLEHLRSVATVRNSFKINLVKFLRKDPAPNALDFEKAIVPMETQPENEIEDDFPLVPVEAVDTATNMVEVKEKPPKRKVAGSVFAKSKQTSDEEYYGILSQKAYAKKQTKQHNPDDKYFSDIIGRIEDKLTEFKIDGQIINILKGPVVDTFELELGSGVKVSKLTSSAEDLSLALYGSPIRIVYPMKGRTTVGIEVPRNPRELIYLDEVIESSEFKKNHGLLPLAMGKDAFGQPFIVDLATMPHMLVAGATGAGKSVFVNTILVSLLIKKSPRQMRMILIDPKQLELALYSKLPHLALPVITDAKTASIALLWAVQEMERRYSILKEFGVRNIEGFNLKLKSAGPDMLANIHTYYQDNGSDEYELPYIVIIVDEFADLILTKAGKEIENNICRLAAKARASGIHLILATQRPSVDVITGLIKSNFPTRVSFRVTSAIDSRTILNAMGAEKLLGKGDMLYKHGVETIRVHSSYVDEEEIEALTDRLSKLDMDYDVSATNFMENGGDLNEDPYAFGSHIHSVREDSHTEDNLYEEAVTIVMEHRSASASMLQRRLKIGYNRAANLIEEMEQKGLIGPAQGSKPRRILHSQDASR